MLTRKSWWQFLAVLCLAAGCSSTITNLTPSRQARNSTGLYPIEVRWDSNERSIRKDTLKPSVVIGFDSYPMQRTALTTNRWETLVPVPTNAHFLDYRFKFDYLYDSIPVARPNSRLSPNYQMEVVDR
jgi:hypothetical protein